MPITAHVRVTKDTEIPDGSVSEGTLESMRNAGGAGFERAMSLVPYGATGDLQRSGFEPEAYGTESSPAIRWGFHAPHALPVEYGSRPHWIPDYAMPGLKKWARLVLGDEGAAHAVRWKIFHEGTDPQPFVRPGILVQRVMLEGTGIASYVVKQWRRKL